MISHAWMVPCFPAPWIGGGKRERKRTGAYRRPPYYEKCLHIFGLDHMENDTKKKGREEKKGGFAMPPSASSSLCIALFQSLCEKGKGKVIAKSCLNWRIVWPNRLSPVWEKGRGEGKGQVLAVMGDVPSKRCCAHVFPHFGPQSPGRRGKEVS